jgi:hypothetical protein
MGGYYNGAVCLESWLLPICGMLPGNLGKWVAVDLPEKFAPCYMILRWVFGLQARA